MANRFWIGTGTWGASSTANWSATSGGATGASAPTSADFVLFDAASGAGTVTIGTGAICLGINASAFTGTFAFGTNKINIAGTGSSNLAGSFAVTGTPLIELTNSSATARTVSTGSATEANSISVNVTAGTGNLTLSGNYRSVDFTGYAGQLQLSSRTIFGDWTLFTGMTLAAGANTTTFGATSGTRTITSNGRTMDFPVNFNGVGGTWTCADAITLGSSRTMTITNGTVQLKEGATSTVGFFATSGTNAKTLRSASAGTQATLLDAVGSVNVSNLTIRDIAATGGATWNAFATNNNVDAGNNSGWNFGYTPQYAYEAPTELRSFTERKQF
jgi:hypothetical protein